MLSVCENEGTVLFADNKNAKANTVALIPDKIFFVYIKKSTDNRYIYISYLLIYCYHVINI